MAVSYHTHSVRCDADDLERAAGRLEIASKAATDIRLANGLRGASRALYALARHNIKTEEDMLTIWSMLWTKEVSDDGD